MIELKVKIDELDVFINAFKTHKDAIDTSVSSIEDPSKSSGIMLTEYINRIRSISALLVKYKELLEKDILDINLSKEKIQEMDKQMVSFSKRI